jgi:hypothetical protein
MLVAIGMWISPLRYFELLALSLWIVGCALVSAAGLIFLSNINKQQAQAPPAAAKAKSAAA